MGSSRSRDASPRSSPPAGRPGTAAPPGSRCGSGAAGPVGSQTPMLAGGGGALATICERALDFAPLPSQAQFRSCGWPALSLRAGPSSNLGPWDSDPGSCPASRSGSGATFEELRLISRKERPRSQTAQKIRKEILDWALLSTHPTVSWRSSKRVCLNLGC